MKLTGFLIALGVLLFAFVWQTSLAGVNRKIVGRLQKRRGPKWYQEFRDIFKAMSKTGITHGWIYDFGVIMAVGGIVGTAMLMPIGKFIAFPGYDNFFIFVYLIAIGMLGMAMSASGSGNPLASIGVMRALTQMLAYEVPFMIVVLTIINMTGKSGLQDIAIYQQNHLWNMFAIPLGGIVGFIALLGMLGKKPFETFIAPAEIASGPMVEYGGKQLGMLMFMHQITVFIEVSLFVNLFLGGATNILEYMIKYFVVYASAELISNVYGRLKIDQVVRFFYRVPIALAIIQAAIVIYGGWVIK